MRWQNLRNIFGERSARVVDEVPSIESRPLTAREMGWVRDILLCNDEWRNADISRTRVISEGPCAEGKSIFLQAPEPENPRAESERESVGNLWINTDEGGVINVQLSQFGGRLTEMYVRFIDAKHTKRKLPPSWVEVSRKAADL